MKNMTLIRNIFLVSILYVVNTFDLQAQRGCEEVNTIQPSIMVLPRTVKGEDLRTIMDEQPEVRVAISKVKQAFDDREYTTLDFETTLKARMRDEVVTKETQTEFKNRIFRNIPSDIIVEIDVIISNLDQGNRATIILEANVTDNGNSMASVPIEGNMYYTPDKILLIGAALKKKNDNNELLLDEFLRKMNEKWAEIREKGKTVKMEFSLSEDANITMDDDVPSENTKLKYLIEDWLEKTAYKNYYVVTFVTETKLMVEEYRYPVRDPKNCTNMTARKIERKLDRFFDKIDLPVKFDNSRGTIYINIL
ncbi:hypothetical protein DKG77_07370 [Flagellimonas aquimarina]|uniref:Uncharacterized protein n=1 Tax=Flagellimonas aquimarina TaxID=2201895 RepID=A0A316KWD2_9FLAO|nr:DUF6175 family protein [Allomuricauda koreensis]PWL38104.1 hypothetical protein DKG77_07370 [Allomuricauda koreensis]